MGFTSQLSLRNKITATVLVVVLTISSIGFGINFYSSLTSLKDNLLFEKILTSKIVGSYMVADLIFNNKETALESLSYLKSDLSIIEANLYDKSNRLFISLYDKPKQYPISPDKRESWHSFHEYTLEIYEPITFDGDFVGALQLVVSISDYTASLKEKIKYLLLMITVLSVAATVLSGMLARRVTEPLSSLTQAVTDLTKEKTNNLNFDYHGEYETEQLVNAFNTLLLQVSTRETERDRAVEKLQQNEKNLSLILDNLIDGLISIDGLGRIQSLNKAAEIQFGVGEADLLQHSIRTLIPGLFETNNTNENSRVETIKKGTEYIAKHSDGSLFPLLVSIAAMPINEESRRLYIVSCVDITAFKLQEEKLLRSQKMDALGNLTGGIAHDYNNMLGVIIGYADLLELGGQSPSKVLESIGRIRHAAERGAKLTNRLLAFSRNSKSDAHELDVNELILQEIPMLEKTLTVRIEIILDLEDKLWAVWLDENQLEDAILNLSINAMHAIQDTGTLLIETRNKSLTSGNNEYSLPNGDYVMLSFRDSGCGLEKKVLERIFEPFYSTKGENGTGLGLSQVYGFVERSSGGIKVISEPGEGAEFLMLFPKYVRDIEEDEAKKTSPSFTGKNIGKILIVDDEHDLLNVTSDILISHGYQTFTASSALTAKKLLREHEFDLVISDIIMPETNGYELAEYIRKHYPDIKIQLASGFIDDSAPHVVDTTLHDQLIYKPFSAKTLIQKVRELLG